MLLKKRQKYLQVALNSTLSESKEIIFQLPISERILIEAGTPLIKSCGKEAISKLKKWSIEKILGPQKIQREKEVDLISLIKFLSEQKRRKDKVTINSLLNFLTEGSKNLSLPFEPYIVADLKCMDLGNREVEIAAIAGASAATCLGQAPIETINNFIKECQSLGIDSMVDMMGIENPILILKKLKKPPDVVILHRGVDETEKNKEKQIPYYQIKQIKGNYNILVAVAGGDTIREVQQTTFNDADIVVVWKNFYQSNTETAQLAESFLREIK